ncbi:MAG: alanine--tRNA ligase [Oceanococcaceae bacterium]
MISTNALRASFLRYFADRDHAVVPSAPLGPGNDPTLLFTNAGMVPFKDVFLGQEQRSYVRAASAQRCVRAGGKHNDLENVGYTARHHTFFEMLGNFSFGDYFKREAIQLAWEFLTRELQIPADKLWVTVFDEDDEAAAIWLDEIGVPAERLSRIGAKDNFWQMGDTGPCGPCSEIFYDHGPDVAGGPPGSPDEDGDRYIEIWNLVFMQYDRASDGTLTPLPNPCVDTGMGLERIAAVLQGVHDNYDTDQFLALLAATRALLPEADVGSRSLRVIADHIRSCAFLIADGVLPANDGRGFVLRRILRRAVRHGHQLGARAPFFHQLVSALAAQMGDAYPELPEQAEFIAQVIRQEEERFAETLEQGLKLLETALAEAGARLDGATAFRLYDTYGFPLDLTQDFARERGVDVDVAGFDAAMQAQRERARAASQFGLKEGLGGAARRQTPFHGYEQLQGQHRVVALWHGDAPAPMLGIGERGAVVLDATPFYAESGGQMGDTGVLRSSGAEFVVEDTRKDPGGAIVHFGVVRAGQLQADDAVAAEVDAERRGRIIRNHSATHLLHAVLREVLGTHVQQKGSLVAPERLRFDFSHLQAVSATELRTIEDRVNAEILKNHPADVRTMSYPEALEFGALALFGEKYGEMVRVLRLGEASCELCGGCHVRATGDIGLFKIVSEGGVASGVRRIEAVTGQGALDWVRERLAVLERAAAALKVNVEEVPERVAALQSKTRDLEKLAEKAAEGDAMAAVGNWLAAAPKIAGVTLVIEQAPTGDSKVLREMVDAIKHRASPCVVLLGGVRDDKVTLIAGVSKDVTGSVKAGGLVNQAAQVVGGRGGGRPDMAQAGGNNPDQLPAALTAARAWAQQQLES